MAWIVWWVATLLTLCHWICPVFYRKPLVVDADRVVERDPGIWSTKVAGTRASLEKAPLFGVYLDVGGERVIRRVSRIAVLSRDAERHSAFFIKEGGEYLYWTLGPGKAWTREMSVQVAVPVDTSRWAWLCGIAGLALAVWQWSSVGWVKGPYLFWTRLLEAGEAEVI